MTAGGLTVAGFAAGGFNDCGLDAGGFNPAGLIDGGLRDFGVDTVLGLLRPDGFGTPLPGVVIPDFAGEALRCGTGVLASCNLLVKLPLILRRLDALEPMLEVLEVTREAGLALEE